MRTTLSLILSMLCVLPLAASQPNLDLLAACRDAYTPDNPEVPLSRQVEVDLLNGQWAQQNTQVYFNEDGTSDWLTLHTDGSWSYQEHTWEMSGTPQAPILEVAGKSGEPTRYRLEPTCQGINLQATGGEESLQLDYRPAASTQQQTRLEKELMGDWEHTLTPAQMTELQVLEAENVQHHRARVRLHFSPHGIFTKELICPEANLHIRETGTWKVSRDGQFVLLNDLHGLIPADSRCLRLKYLELDELVLEQALAFADTRGSLPRQDFYFNKH